MNLLVRCVVAALITAPVIAPQGVAASDPYQGPGGDGSTRLQSSESCGDRIREYPGSWARIEMPDTPAHESSGAVDIAVDPTRPDQLFLKRSFSLPLALAGNEVKTLPDYVMRSRDGGCSWEKIFEVPASPTAELPIASYALGISYMEAGPGRLYLVLMDKVGMDRLQPPVAYIATSSDDGASWQYSQVSPGNWTGIEQLAVSQSKPDVLYILTIRHLRGKVGEPTEWGTSLLRSSDAGVSWVQSGTDLSETGCDIAVDPAEPDLVWAWDDGAWNICRNDGLYVSRNGGAAWEEVPLPTSQVRDVAIFHEGSTHRIVVTGVEGSHSDEVAVAMESTDGGLTWKDARWNPYTDPDEWVIFGTSPNVLIGYRFNYSSLGSAYDPYEGQAKGMFRYDPRAKRWVDITPLGGEWQVGNPVMVRSGGRAVFYFTQGREALWRYTR